MTVNRRLPLTFELCLQEILRLRAVWKAKTELFRVPLWSRRITGLHVLRDGQRGGVRIGL